MKGLTVAQRQCINRITGQAVTRGRCASDALTRAFGAYDARDQSPATLAVLRKFDSKLRELSAVLHSNADAARDVSAAAVTDAALVRPPQRRRRSRLHARLFACDFGAERDAVEVPIRPVDRRRRSRLSAGEFCIGVAFAEVEALS